MNRSVLIVTPFFAPQNHSAMFRAYKLAKYLPQFGWKPIVLTVDTQYLYNEDASLIPDLPQEVEVVRAPYVEPSLRGLRMALGGRDRTFKTMKKLGAVGAATSVQARNQACVRICRCELASNSRCILALGQSGNQNRRPDHS